MSTQTATPTIEDSIKTALDAADAAITVSGEFAQIRTDYAKTRTEVKAINRQVMIVFISSLAASVLAVAAAGLIYFRTMTEMQTTNATSLEALVIFAENVDRLAAATTEANAQSEQIATLVAGTQALEAMMGDLIARIDAQTETTQAGLAGAQTEIAGVVTQSATSVIAELGAAIAANQSDLAAQIATLREAAETGTDAPPPQQLVEMSATLETMMMLQREISAKITAASTPPRQPARTEAPAAPRAAPRDNDMIKFP